MSLRSHIKLIINGRAVHATR